MIKYAQGKAGDRRESSVQSEHVPVLPCVAVSHVLENVYR
jgi:hypothetical protein